MRSEPRARTQAAQARQAVERAQDQATQAAKAAQEAAKAGQPDQAEQAKKAQSEEKRATQAMEAARAAEAQAAQARASQTPADDGPAREVYTTEYEGGAKRYEDIYKAIWQNFSYMAVLAGAILTFGKDSLGTELAAFIACFPLLFWFWATFEPLNKYGDDVVKRLSEIEQALNQLVFGAPERGMSHFRGFHTREEPSPLQWVSLSTWQTLSKIGAGILVGIVLSILGLKLDFKTLCSKLDFKWYFVIVGALILLVLIVQSCRKQLRVRTAMRMFVFLIHLLAIWLGYGLFVKPTNTLASGIQIEAMVTSIGAQDRKIQVELLPVPAIEPGKLSRLQKVTFVVPNVEATVISVDLKKRSLQLELPPATALELIAPSQKARLNIEP
jgi:hypothetical protein